MGSLLSKNRKKVQTLDLGKCTYANTKPYIPDVQNGKVVKVYDGDTIHVATIMPTRSGRQIYRFSVRLNGIDTPELKTKDTYEKQAAIFARDALSELILNKTVSLKNVSLEKYGRLLADVYIKNVCVNNWLLQNHYAIPYYGKTKEKVNWKQHLEKFKE